MRYIDFLYMDKKHRNDINMIAALHIKWVTFRFYVYLFVKVLARLGYLKQLGLDECRAKRVQEDVQRA